MGIIAENIQEIKSKLPATIKLVAVSKTKPIEDIQDAYNGGQRIFGENKIQELVYKHESLPEDIQWHMIGHLQTNKVKYIAGFISLIHSVDSIKLLRNINKEAAKNNRVIDCLLQVKIASEDSKFGLDKGQLDDFLQLEEFKSFENIRIIGLMGMATFSYDQEQIRNEFKVLKEIFTHVKSSYYKDANYFSEISMGMSDDYIIAIEEGSTMIRVGSSIFGKRNYT
jgi:PLP dependent protein